MPQPFVFVQFRDPTSDPPHRPHEARTVLAVPVGHQRTVCVTARAVADAPAQYQAWAEVPHPYELPDHSHVRLRVAA